MYHNEQAPATRQSHSQPALLVFRVIGIRDGDREGINENRGGLIEIDTVLSQIALGLTRIPLKLN